MKNSLRKLKINLAVAVVTIFLICILTACKDGNVGEDIKKGTDEYGRTYGEVYSIDGCESGIYRVRYSIEDTSDIGKIMISQYCADYVKLKVEDGVYQLTFYCKSDALKDVRADLGEQMIDGKSVEEGDLYGYAFSLDRGALDDKIGMECTVKLMNKRVQFSLIDDLNYAILVG